MKVIYELTMRETQTGRIYSKMADIFKMSDENRIIFNALLDEPNNETAYMGADVDWVIKMKELFPIRITDKYLWYSELEQAVKDESELRRQKAMN